MNYSKIRHGVFIGFISIIYALTCQKFINSGSNLLIYAIPGAFISFYFFNNSMLCFWTIFFGAMFAGIAVSYIPGMFNLRWGINILSLLIGTIVTLKIMLNHKNFILRSNIIFTLFALFFIYSILSSIVNVIPMKQLIISIKNNFQFLPLLLFFLVYPLSATFPKQLIKAIIVVALFQPPIALLQYFFIVPYVKQSTVYAGTAMLDAVNGSFGTHLRGGGSGMYTLFTCTILCGLIAAYGQKIINTKKYLLFSIYILFPMFLNETKAAFIFLFFGSLVVIGFNHRIKIKKKILLSILAAFIGVVMIWFTFQMIASHGKNVDETIQQTLSYNFGEEGYGSYQLNRLTCITFWWQENKGNIIDLLIGHGLDSTIEDKSGLSDIGEVAKRHPMYGTGLTTASTMLWELGIIGFTLFITIFLLGFKQSLKLSQSTELSSTEKLIALCTGAGISMTILLFFYNSLFRNSQPANLFIILMIGITISLSLRQKTLLKNPLS
jgi:hypothetical protein